MKKQWICCLAFFASFINAYPCFAEETSFPGAKELGFLHYGFFFSQPERFFIARVGIALILGCLAGISHDYRYKKKISRAGVSLKTYGSVAIGAASFSGIATYIYLITGGAQAFSMITGIISGIGFLCGAVIFKEGLTIYGLSTAATVWTTAAVGVACGAGLFGVAIVITAFVVFFHLLPKRQNDGFAKGID